MASGNFGSTSQSRRRSGPRSLGRPVKPRACRPITRQNNACTGNSSFDPITQRQNNPGGQGAVVPQFAMVVCGLRPHTPLLIGLAPAFIRHRRRPAFAPLRVQGGALRVLKPSPSPRERGRGAGEEASTQPCAGRDAMDTPQRPARDGPSLAARSPRASAP